MQRNIRVSAKGLIIRDGKMAAVRIQDGADEWYIMPGGGQDPEETLPEAVCREIAEELGLLDKVLESGWKALTAKETGRIGGMMTRRKKELNRQN